MPNSRQSDILQGDAPIADRLFQTLADFILSGVFAPGERLTEPDLAQRFQVSRAPVREALRRLEERQIVERVPFCGVRVLVPSSELLADLQEIREVLECLACRRAAEVITPEQVAELRAYLTEDTGRLNSLDDTRHLPAIRDFHIRIAEIAGNSQLLRMLNQEIWRYLRAGYRRRIRSLGRLPRALEEHGRILDALERHDGELAAILMQRHLAGAHQSLSDVHTGADG